MYLWDQVDGKNGFNVIPWVPYVYIPYEGGDVKTLDGLPVIKREFDEFYEYQDYQKDNHDIYENQCPKEIQFLAERYHTVNDEDIEAPNLTIYSIDMEVGTSLNGEDGFPKPSTASQTITLINIRDFGRSNISFGIKPYNGPPLDGNTFIYCKSEIELLQRFYEWFQQNPPDVITGWNIIANSKMNPNGGFDFPYLINRTKNLFGIKTDLYKKLSPIGIVRTWEDRETGVMNVNIAGVSIIDYLALFKWYSPIKPDNYKLDTVSQTILEKGKLDYSEYGNLNNLFHKNWDMYVDYNMIDNKRIEELEDKLGYIRLAQNLSLLCRCGIEQYQSSVALIEGSCLTHYRRNGLCAPKLVGGNQEWFPAAYVKPPQKGRYWWVIDVDVTSSYPTGVITLNMSPETYYGRLIEYYSDKDGRWINILSSNRESVDIEAVINSETPITEFVMNRKFPPFKLLRDTGLTTIEGGKLETFNKALQKGLLCVAPCGSMFTTNKKGKFAEVCQNTFNKRVEVKEIMKNIKIEAQKTTDENKKRELDIKAANLFALQWALKLVINSMYGVTGVPYSRYFNINISEAVTSCGRRAVYNGQKYVNQLLNNPKDDSRLDELLISLGSTSYPINNKDYVIYCDTDSIFLKCQEFLFDNNISQDLWNSYTDEDKTKVILRLSSIIEDRVNKDSFEITQLGEYNSQVRDFAISFKQEIVCKSALMVAMKKYGFHVVNKEHVPCDEVDVKGLEIIRSETPAIFRQALKDLLTMILKGASDEDILKVYNEGRKVSLNSKIEDLSENKGVKNIGKYIAGGNYIKGTPYHVKAVYNYHRLLKELGLENKYPEILEDSKNKLIYVKANNFGVKTIMYDEVYPEEFHRLFQVDLDLMLEKYYTKKLRMLLEPMGKEYIIDSNQSFASFFG